MTPNRIALAVALSCSALTCAYAAPAATVLFTQPGSTIVDASGKARPVRRGDVVQIGERLVTAPNGISQVAMPDGSLVGMRPGSELRFEQPGNGAEGGRQMVSLVQGAVRVIGAELMDPNKLSALAFRSGEATLQMRGADLETARVVGASAPGTSEGSYSRLLVGTASIGTAQTVTALAPRQVSFVAPASITPVTVTPPLTLFGSLPITAGPILAPIGGSVVPAKTALVGSVVAPTPATSTLTSPPPLVTSTTLAGGIVQPPKTIQPVTTVALATPIAKPIPTAPIAVFTPPVVAPPPIVVQPVYIPPTITVAKPCISIRTVCK